MDISASTLHKECRGVCLGHAQAGMWHACEHAILNQAYLLHCCIPCPPCFLHLPSPHPPHPGLGPAALPNICGVDGCAGAPKGAGDDDGCRTDGQALLPVRNGPNSDAAPVAAHAAVVAFFCSFCLRPKKASTCCCCSASLISNLRVNPLSRR